MPTRRLDGTQVYLWMQGSSAFFFSVIVTVNLVYQADTVGLNPLQLVLVGTTLELSAFLFEVPTGVVADIYSRRLSVIIGMALIGLGFTLEGSIPRFGAVLAAQVLWGLGYTFTSGATEAWLADEIGEEEAGRAFLRGSQLHQAAVFLGIPVSVALASWQQIQWPIVAGGLGYVALALVLAFTMPERGFKPAPAEERETWRHMLDTARTGVRTVRGRPALLILVGLGLVAGLYSEGYDRLWTPHLLQNFTFPSLLGLEAVVWFGVIRAGSSVMGIAANELARRNRTTDAPGRIINGLTLLYGLVFLGLVGLAWFQNFWLAVAALWLISLSRSTIGPLESAWIVQNTAGPARATIISLWSQANAVGQIVGGPGVGWIGTVTGLRLALSAAAGLLLPAQILLALARRLQKQPQG